MRVGLNDLELLVSFAEKNNKRLLSNVRAKARRGESINVLVYEPKTNISKYSLVKALTEVKGFRVFLGSHDSAFLSDKRYSQLDLTVVIGKGLSGMVNSEDYDFDVVFVENPHKYFHFHEPTYDFYSPIPKSVFDRVLLCYVPYAYICVKDNHAYDDAVHRFVWKFFLESVYHCQQARLIQPRVENLVVTGHPYLDSYYESYDRSPPKGINKILWAPHHNPVFYNGVSLREQDFIFRKILREFDVDLIFRPHPNLFSVLDSDRHRASKNYKVLLDYEYFLELKDFYESHPRVECAYTGSIAPLFERADLIVSNCGGFQMETLHSGRFVVNLINPRLLNNQLIRFQEHCYCPSESSEFEHLLCRLLHNSAEFKVPDSEAINSQLPDPGTSGMRIARHLAREFGIEF